MGFSINARREKGRFVYISFTVVSGSKFREKREKEKWEWREKKRKKIKNNFQNEPL